jgi:Uma2 family endonuclease
MAALTLELPPRRSQTEFHLRRWAELLADPLVAKVEGRVETDRHGRVIMSPPPAPSHGSYQSRIASLLDRLTRTGRVLTECPISTADGVKAADVAWASPECMQALGSQVCFTRAPEICVEVQSPSNTDAEFEEKKVLYFDAGAREVWVCSDQGAMTFYTRGLARSKRTSRICPEFPSRVELR